MSRPEMLTEDIAYARASISKLKTSQMLDNIRKLKEDQEKQGAHVAVQIERERQQLQQALAERRSNSRAKESPKVLLNAIRTSESQLHKQAQNRSAQIQNEVSQMKSLQQKRQLEQLSRNEQRKADLFTEIRKQGQKEKSKILFATQENQKREAEYWAKKSVTVEERKVQLQQLKKSEQYLKRSLSSGGSL